MTRCLSRNDMAIAYLKQQKQRFVKNKCKDSLRWYYYKIRCWTQLYYPFFFIALILFWTYLLNLVSTSIRVLTRQLQFFLRMYALIPVLIDYSPDTVTTVFETDPRWTDIPWLVYLKEASVAHILHLVAGQPTMKDAMYCTLYELRLFVRLPGGLPWRRIRWPERKSW